MAHFRFDAAVCVVSLSNALAGTAFNPFTVVRTLAGAGALGAADAAGCVSVGLIVHGAGE